MRDVDPAVITAMDDSRVVTGRLTFRDILPRWTNKYIDDGSTLTNGCFYDVSGYGTGFLRVMSVYDGGWAYRLYYQYVSSPDSSWPSWTNSGITLYQGSGIALFGGRLFYQALADSDYYYRDFNGSTFGAATKFHTAGTDHCNFAPVSSAICYIWTIDSDGFDHVMRRIIGGATAVWPGALDGGNTLPIHFDAVLNDGHEHIYMTERDGTRGMTMKYRQAWYSDLKPIIPLDTTDDTLEFIPGKASSATSGDIILTGYHKREDVDVGFYHFHSYHLGKSVDGVTRYSMGREMFIHEWPTATSKSITIGGAGHSFTLQKGKILNIGSKIWYVGPGYAYYSDETYLFGDDLSSRKTVVTDFNSVSMEFNKQGPSGMSGQIATSEYDALMKPGTELAIECAYDGNYAQLGVFDVDAVVDSNTALAGKSYDFMAQSKSIKRLKEWSPDAAYDYWSQAKTAVVSTDMSKLVRVTGDWDEAGYGDLDLITMNEKGYIYCVNKASRGGLVVGDFHIPVDLSYYGSLCGVIQAFYRETTGEAKIRLDQDTVSDYDVGVNGIAFTYHDYGTPEFELYLIEDNVYTSMADTGATGWHNTQIALAMRINDGRVRCFYRLVSSATWISVFDMEIDENIYKRDDIEGRHGVIMLNASTNGTCYEFRSTDTVVPVKTNFSEFDVEDTIIIDSEQMVYEGKSHLESEVTGLSYSPGIVMESQTVLGAENQNFADIEARNYVMQKFELSEDILSFGVEVYIRKVGTPDDGVEVGLYKGPSSSRFPLGRKLCSAIIPADEISTSYGWHLAMFNAPQELKSDDADNEHLWILMTRQEDPANPDPSNYFQVALETPNCYGATSGIDFHTFNDSTDTWTRTVNRDMAFRIYGGEEYNANEIYVSGISDPTHFDDYNDAALLVTGGKGEDRIFRVIEYDGMATANIGCFMVEEDADNVVGPDSTFKLVSTLIVTERGHDDTNPLPHSLDSKVSVYRDSQIRMDFFKSFSPEIDMRTEDMLREILVKSGTDAHCKKWMSSDPGLSGSGWLTSAAYGNNRVNDPIVRFYISSLLADEVGVIFKSAYSLTTGLVMTVSHTHLNFYYLTGGSTYNLKERYPIDAIPNGWITMSITEPEVGYYYLSCWVNERFIGSFYMTGDYSDGYVRFVSYNTQPLTGDLSECYMRVDNFIMDMGMDGGQLLGRLLREKRIIFRDDQDGILYAFKNRVTANSSPYTLAVGHERANSGNNVVTRMRYRADKIGNQLVGDYFDPSRDLIRSYGNVFRLIDLQIIESARELLGEMSDSSDDVRRSFYTYSVNGAADPRLEAGDVFEVTLPSPHGDVLIDVERVNCIMMHSTDAVLFDMSIKGGEEIDYS